MDEAYKIQIIEYVIFTTGLPLNRESKFQENKIKSLRYEWCGATVIDHYKILPKPKCKGRLIHYFIDYKKCTCVEINLAGLTKTKKFMSIIKAIKRLEYANFLIKKRATGDLNTFARKMKLSKRAMSGLLIEMKDLGAAIQYDRVKKTYFYIENGELCISRFMKYGEILTRQEISEIGKPEDLCFSEKTIFVLCSEL